MSLKEYSRKRDFKKTAEPHGQHVSGAGRRFVIQKHAASRLHYDFRLEIGGALKSWAVPKGVPFAKGEKRLAVEVEDHPVSYIDFEGTIPKGQYGGGTVMVWDRGTFEPLSEHPAKELAGGKLHFVLHGQKLEGEWYLVRLRGGKDWLLIRGQNDMRPVSKKADDTSALSGKTMEELSKGTRVWQSKPSPCVKPVITKPKEENRGTLGAPAFIEPMKARMAASPPEGGWIYEIKLDGFRTLALKDGNKVRLLSRNEKDFGEKFPEVAEAVAKIAARDAILDGEVVALDAKGRSSFQLLQAYDLGEERPPIFYYVFDLLRLNGVDLQKEPLAVRKAKLAKILKSADGVIRYSASLEGPVIKLLKQAKKLGLEGLIGKRNDSVYEAGRRSGAWIKLKLHHEQEMVIGGYTGPEGSRSHFGALLVGFYEGLSLRFAGKVGTGFNDALLKELYSRLQKIGQGNCPFTNLPEEKSGRYGGGMTAAEMKRCHWVKPKLVGEVKFSEWTRDGKLRQPVFLGLREDKETAEVIREKAR
jgi:bifunctional non-homologous end joining protein LigD